MSVNQAINALGALNREVLSAENAFTAAKERLEAVRQQRDAAKQQLQETMDAAVKEVSATEASPATAPSAKASR